MKRVELFLICFCFFALVSSVVSGQSPLDSIQQVINSSEDDTNKVKLLNHSSYKYGDDYPVVALKYAERAVKLAEELDFKRGLATAFANVGILSYNRGLFDEAMEYYNVALKIRLEINHRLGIAYSYTTIGNVYLDRGDYSLALEYHIKVLQIHESLELRDKMNVAYTNIGAIYYYQGDYARSIEYFYLSLEIEKESGDSSGMADSYNNIASLYYEEGDFKKASENFEKAIEIRESLKQRSALVSSYLNLGALHQEMEKYELSLTYYRLSLELAEEFEDVRSISMAYHNIGELHQIRDELQEAKVFFKKSLNISLSARTKYDIQNSAKALSLICAEMKNYKDAHEYHHLFTLIKDSLFNEDKSKEIGRLEANYELGKQIEEERRVAEKLAKEEADKKARRDNLQYSGILIFIVGLGALLLTIGKLPIPIRLAEGLIFFTFLLFFEFTLVLLDPYIEQYSSGAPAIKLAFNALLAALIFPLHSYFENTIKAKMNY